MSEQESWIHPGVDEHGFISLDELRLQHAGKSLHDFLRICAWPALLAVHRGSTESGLKDLFPTDEGGVQLLTVETRGHAFLRYLGKVAFVAKRPGNPFGHLISIGRSPQNDITLAVESVSKVHGYFVPQGGDWFYTDHGSTNGSILGDQMLSGGGKYPLREDHLLRLGPEVMLEFLSPEGLYRKLRKG